jgi:hypothetical protein
MSVGRRLPATLLLVAITACSEPFEAATAGNDAQTNPFQPDAKADAAAQPEAPMLSEGSALADVPSEEAGLVPPVADGLLLWLRADVGVTQIRGTIATWADQSGHHSDAVQTDPTKQPTLGSGGPARAGVMFDTDDFMSLPAGFGDFSLGISMFAVYSSENTDICADALDFSNGPEVDDITLGRHMSALHYEVSANSMPGDPMPVGMQALGSVVHSPDQTVQLRVNGAPFTVGTFELPASVTRLSNVVGRSLYADCGTLNGGVWEALVYGRALDNDERVRVESYLQTRWDCCR